MGKNKLRKFAEMEQIEFVFQYPFSVLRTQGFPLKGCWGTDFFGNSNPIVLELGCGKGEYTVGLARRYPHMNFIGIDIKGARMWSGAKQAQREGLRNVAFLRTSIELLPEFFSPGEVSEIWITFPDPQMKKATKRLTGSRFMGLYRQVMPDGGIVNLKSDSPFLYTYTSQLCGENPQAMQILRSSDNLYADNSLTGPLTEIRTHYEQQWLDRGLTIKYIQFRLMHAPEISEIDDTDIPRDTYRSYSRGELECPQLLEKQD